MADISFVWNMDDDRCKALAQTRIDQAIAGVRDVFVQQGSEWCVAVSDAISEMKNDECHEIEMIGILAQIGMMSVLANQT